MALRIELDFRRAARRLIPSGAHVLAAVSGGGDSVALLHLLLRYSAGADLALSVAHLDHGLRRGSRTDRRFVERLAREHALQCVSDRRELLALRRRGESPEEAARRVRRRFLLDAASDAGATLIALGHTLDDQAETVLMRLARGAGPAALAGMAASGPGPFIRPLLGIERIDLRNYLQRRALPYRDDPSNRDMRHDRNRARRLVLPVLAEALNPHAARHLVGAAERLREDADYLDRAAHRTLNRISRTNRAGRLVLDVSRLAASAPPIAKRVARLALQRSGIDPRRITAKHIEALVELATGPGGRELHLPSHTLARRTGKRITLTQRPTSA
jgi:tRNA(Ile)-lysidine synthetase-like protein